jgi:hypothetical protein
LPGTAELPPFISSSTSYPELDSAVRGPAASYVGCCCAPTIRRSPIRPEHYGQWPHPPHQPHPTNAAATSESSCQGAVHT